MKQIFLFVSLLLCLNVTAKEKFPDGTPIPDWFYKNTPVDIAKLGKAYRITDYGVAANDSNLLQTEAIQSVIDKAALSLAVLFSSSPVPICISRRVESSKAATISVILLL